MCTPRPLQHHKVPPLSNAGQEGLIPILGITNAENGGKLFKGCVEVKPIDFALQGEELE